MFSVPVNERRIHCQGFERDGMWHKAPGHLETFTVIGLAEGLTKHRGYLLCRECRKLSLEKSKEGRETTRKLSRRNPEIVALLKEKSKAGISDDRLTEIDGSLDRIGRELEKEIGMTPDQWASYVSSFQRSLDSI